MNDISLITHTYTEISICVFKDFCSYTVLYHIMVFSQKKPLFFLFFFAERVWLASEFACFFNSVQFTFMQNLASNTQLYFYLFLGFFWTWTLAKKKLTFKSEWFEAQYSARARARSIGFILKVTQGKVFTLFF